MSAPTTTLQLDGVLGKRFGRKHRFELSTQTTAEAMRAACAVIPGFRQFLANAREAGLVFAVFRGTDNENIAAGKLREPAGGVVRLTPIPAGSKKAGVLSVIVGVVLIALSFVPGFQAAAPALMSAGIGMIAGGIVQMLSPVAKLGKNADSANNQASYVFNGPVNTTAQGNPKQLLYGRMLIGSAVLSAGSEAEDYSAATNTVTPGTPGAGTKLNPYEVLA